MKAIFTILIILSAINGFASAQNVKFDSTETINGVKMGSGKSDGVRTYQGEMEKTFIANIEDVYASVMDFESRCNNEHKDRRKIRDEKFNCKYFNKNMVETIVINKILPGQQAQINEVKRFAMKRYIYNRGSFQHTELGQVFKYKNDKKQDTYKIQHRMVSDKEAATLIDKPAKKESAFIETKGVFVLTKISEKKTHLHYIYTSRTDHWLLNKSMVVGEFFENMSKGVNNLFTTLTTDIVAKATPVKKDSKVKVKVQ